VDDSESNGPQGSVEPTSDGEATVPSLDPLAPGQTMLVTAIYKYAAAAADELSLIEGSQILVTEVAEDGWVYGSSCLTGAVGWFHGSYVQPDKDAKFVVGAKSFTPAPGSRQAEKALSFSANERLRVLAETSETWWIAQKQTEGRQVGFIPAKYVKLAPLPRPRALKSIKGTSGGGGGVDGDAPDLEPELSVSPDPVPEIWLDLETAEKQFVQSDRDFQRRVSRRSSSLVSTPMSPSGDVTANGNGRKYASKASSSSMGYMPGVFPVEEVDLSDGVGRRDSNTEC